jgi:hypothetical protein
VESEEVEEDDPREVLDAQCWAGRRERERDVG